MRVNDNDGGGDGDGNHADEGGSDDMMDRRMMVMMTATAMRVMMTITTRNDGAGDSDDLFGLNWWMPGFPQPAALTRREAKCLCAKRNAHRQSPKKTLPRQALTLSPTMPNAPEAAPDLRFALPGGTPLSRTSAEKIVHLDPADWIR